MGDPDRLERAFLAELDFECGLAIDAWNRFLALSREPEQGLIQTPVEYSLVRWSCVDSFLVHVVRIDDMVHPSRGRDEAWSYEERCRLAATARKFTDRELLSSKEVRNARHIVQHLIEYLPAYIRQAGAGFAGPFEVGPTVFDAPRGPGSPLRALDTFTGECEVMGHHLNLKSLLADVRALKVALPERSLWGEVHLTKTLAAGSADPTVSRFSTGGGERDSKQDD